MADTTEAAPAWFQAAVAADREEGQVDVAGCPIHYLAWGDRDDPTLVLVHGGAAHAHWWSPLAPLLATTHRVVAVDLSGHGDSGHRDVYSARVWADEVVEVADAAGGRGRPVVAGHSMGGFVTILAAAVHGHRLEGGIVLDAPVQRPDPESAEARGGRMFRAPKTYPDLATGMAHFHLVPPQPCDNAWILQHVARHSLHEVDDGWTWKFDPRLFTAWEGPRKPSDVGPELARAACRIAMVYGEHSDIVDDKVRGYAAELLAGSPAAVAGVPFVDVPAARHHLLLDQPLAVVTALRSVLAGWHPVGTPPAEVTTDASDRPTP